MPDAEVRVHFAALVVALVKAGELDAADALWEWAEEWLDVNREELEEELSLEENPELGMTFEENPELGMTFHSRRIDA